jgi:hypothetical protein
VSIIASQKTEFPWGLGSGRLPNKTHAQHHTPVAVPCLSGASSTLIRQVPDFSSGSCRPLILWGVQVNAPKTEHLKIIHPVFGALACTRRAAVRWGAVALCGYFT